MKIVIEIFTFLFGGCLASFFISRYYFKRSVKIEFNKKIEDLKNEHDKRLLIILTNVINKMEDCVTQYSFRHDKDSYTPEDVESIVQEKVNQVLRQRNIQLQQFIEDAITEQN